jgi:glycosyltransferase involved in cell wall biosynthesis
LRDASPRLLFVPVSGPFGMGEYARCSAIARAVLERWPAASVHFMLSREAPYASSAPFPATLLPSSATFHTAAVVERIESWRPQVVIFDNAGRSAQLEAAQRSGARVVYISARGRQRYKAFRLRWMRLIDEHWIAYPQFIAGGLGIIERLKQRLLHRPTVRYLDVILSRAGSRAAGADADKPSDARGEQVLVVPGGGTGHPGAERACAEFLRAARGIAAAGFPVRYVGPAVDRSIAAGRLEISGSLAQYDLAELMRRARLVVVNGGSTLLQALACGAACVAVPIAGDQRQRIRRCAAGGVAVEAGLASSEIEARALALLRDEPSRAALERRARGLALADGIELALNALRPYIESA